MSHSIADACAISINTPVGTVFFSGDFKLDLTPVEGKIMDIPRIGEIGNKGVALLCLRVDERQSVLAIHRPRRRSDVLSTSPNSATRTRRGA